MIELLLFRHGKSRWDEPGVEDHDRSLAPRGEKAAARMGRLLAAERLVPDLVLCSTARRAVQTWELAGAALLPAAPRVIHSRELYMAPPGRLSDLVRRHGGNVPRLMVVGHNPGLHAFAVRLVGKGDARLRAQLGEKFPTAALARLSFKASRWEELSRRTGTLEAFWRPRDLDQHPA